MRPGAAVEDFSAPLFIAWQLTNSCAGRCPSCCEESGPDKGWSDELTREEALDVARQITEAGIPYVAFGGGEPLGVPHVWEIFETLSEAGTAIKIETDGRYVDAAAATRMAGLRVDNAQISVDGARPETHALMRPGSASFEQATGALRRLSDCGVPAEMVFTPTTHNLAEMADAFDLAVELGCSAFVTGPLMRLGRAAASWSTLMPDPEAWAEAVTELRMRAALHRNAPTRLSIYPHDIEQEIADRLDSPQAMMLIVPNGRVKLLNALPFAPGDLRQQSVLEAWGSYQRAWRSPQVADFIHRCADQPDLLLHANETWSVA
ncbi:radical SAM protein [Rhodovibrio salinarum]|uniref:Radical SAM protein n=1 Tax=Rhodovibrio salinarum TaxID=1087 RepID=A0A934QJ18_9PROT|nr:radical SAM protein [Rhodovibrio salinarum]MBK1697789.1 radical SAM protein [Rhodovibrio salinarum]